MRVKVVGTGRTGLLIAGVLAWRADVNVFEVAEGRLERIDRECLLDCFRGVGGALGKVSEETARLIDESEICEEVSYVVISPDCANVNGGESGVDALCTRYVDLVVSGAAEGRLRPVVVIASPVSCGFTDRLCASYPDARFLFCSDFACKWDVAFGGLRPSHVVMGIPETSRFASDLRSEAESFAGLLLGEDGYDDSTALVVSANEAESVRFFSDKYLEMQESFVEGLREFSDRMGLDVDSIVAGLGLGGGTGFRSNL